jgi:hypothetical protein
LTTEERGLPVGAVVTAAGATDGVPTRAALEAMVVPPPARADGACGNRPRRARAEAAGFRLQAPGRGQARRPGIGRVRCAAGRGHASLAQFGRIARRLDRCARRDLGWIELAACVIFIRAEAHGFFRQLLILQRTVDWPSASNQCCESDAGGVKFPTRRLRVALPSLRAASLRVRQPLGRLLKQLRPTAS